MLCKRYMCCLLILGTIKSLGALFRHFNVFCVCTEVTLVISSVTLWIHEYQPVEDIGMGSQLQL